MSVILLTSTYFYGTADDYAEISEIALDKKDCLISIVPSFFTFVVVFLSILNSFTVAFYARFHRIDVVRSMDEAIDIHHIFPDDYCKEKGYPKEKWNSIINKTPLLPESNRAIGGEAPSVYKDKILNRAQISMAQLQERLESHWVDVDAFLQDDFERYFIARAKKMLLVIEEAMGKSVADKASEQTIKQFGQSLA